MPKGVLPTFLYRGSVPKFRVSGFTKTSHLGLVNYSLRKILFMGSEGFSLKRLNVFALKTGNKVAKRS